MGFEGGTEEWKARALTDMRVKGGRAGRQANPPVDPEPDSTANPRASGQRSAGMLPRKTSKVSLRRPVPETDTGGRGENPKALE